MRFLFCSLLLVFFLTCEEEPMVIIDPMVTPDTTVVETVAYLELPGVAPDLLSLDIYWSGTTAAAPRPVVLYVHGGGWSIGDKANQIMDKVNLFRSEDYLFVSTNYRLTPVDGSGGEGRVKFPDHNRDVAAAVRWVYDNIAAYGGDPNRIALIGHSAGAHLVALTGTNADFLEQEGLSPTLLRGVAAIDTEGYDVGARVADGNEIYLNAFGSDPDVHRQASPLFNVDQGQICPNFFIAKRGSARRISIANEFITALEGAGVTVQQIDGSIYSHAGINEAIGEQGEAVVTPALLAFFAEVFGE